MVDTFIYLSAITPPNFNAVPAVENERGTVDAAGLPVAVPEFDLAEMAEVFVGIHLYR
jgi:hypothetical protein